jgi:hypothetical protein
MGAPAPVLTWTPPVSSDVAPSKVIAPAAVVTFLPLIGARSILTVPAPVGQSPRQYPCASWHLYDVASGPADPTGDRGIAEEETVSCSLRG